MMSKDKDDVGYKKPPKKTQFKKGQSGNPKGRPPRASPNTLEGILSIMQKEVPVTMNGELKNSLKRAYSFFKHTKRHVRAMGRAKR